jgi:hypothetical protein
MTYRQVWRYARDVGYERSLRGWWRAFSDLCQASPTVRTWVLMRPIIDEHRP